MEPENLLEPISLHPKAYRFFPKREEEKSCFEKKGTRYYFMGQVQHDQYQLRKLKQLHQYVQNKGKTYNKNMFPNDHSILILLASKKYKPKETLKAMEEYCEFKLMKVPSMSKQKVEDLLKTGFFYVCGRDNYFRPIIVFKIKLIQENKLDLATDAMIYAMQEICSKMLIPGQVQNWNFIYDLAGISNLLDLPITAIKKIVTSLQMLYSFKLWRSFVLNAPSSMTIFFKLISAFMDDATVQKTKISKYSTDKSLFQNIHPSQIQQKYGGTQPNRVEFYPFTVPKAVFSQNRLINDQQYQKLLDQGKLARNKIDPIFNEKKQ